MNSITKYAMKNVTVSLVFLTCHLVFSIMEVQAAEDRLINIKPQTVSPQTQTPGYTPGTAIVLPDGRRGIIEAVLPNGRLRTDLGVILLPDGKLEANPEQKAEIIVPEEIPQIATPKAEEAPAMEERQTVPSLLPGTPDEKAQAAVVRPEAAPDQPEAPIPDAEKGLTLAELIPLTTAKQDQPKAPEAKKTVAPDEPHKKPKASESKVKTPDTKAKEPEKRSEKKNAPEVKKQPKAKAGQELHIPEEAIRTGKLDFLEGCWEGRRPEYYSKRIIRECFCFDANGGSGKRRIFDTQGARMCIGSSKASLSKNGVLSVTSQGAACDDGERWGQAEMVCKNSGSKSPCSWVFRDAQNGHQSYVIPFVKVDSCRR